ncbi:ABC transporter substrate-binding protein [Rhodoferax sp. TBRC 17198]|uniref:ABC transporter substrate-binding protein n=1 Tax=Rhodoferax potami TaxID=3068338 RepID=UPI0028BD1CA9|nr:ABC transporter substrate-binding protein [Rhodoferax sp. TBRC 17198]MDT7521286.1 ABC transporter substrate-binding protein [Rhodoferax sp. TBRC 17198]
MNKNWVLKLGAAALTAPLLAGASWAQQTTLRVFVGPNQRPDLQAKLFEQYTKANPNVKVEIETGGATSELQRQYLSTVLNAKDSAIDLFMIDIVNPAQYASKGWIEPLDKYVGGAASLRNDYLPVYQQANIVDGKVMALPSQGDSMFMYYRKDLLAKHGIAEPKTWDELSAAAKKITAAENNPNLQGLSLQGAPIEGAVCTFLLPYWGQGKQFNDAAGKLTLDKSAAVNGLKMWLKMMDDGVVKKNIAEVTTPVTVNEFKAGNVVFAINWGFAFDRFKDDADSKVKNNVGVIPLPAMNGGKSATCMGGWQWAMNAFGKNKDAAGNLIKFLSSKEASAFVAREGSILPVYQSLYSDPAVIKAVPWFKDALPVVLGAQSRPMVEDYGQVSDIIRTTTSAVLARTKTPEAGVDEIAARVSRLMR